MSRTARIPRELSFLPFVGSRAVAKGLLSRAMLRGAAWQRLLPDIYVHRDGYQPENHRMWCEAVALTLPPGAAFTGLSAAYLWGVDLLDRQTRVSVALPNGTRRRRHPRIVYGHPVLGPADHDCLAGLPVTTPIRTAFDLGRQASLVDSVVAVDALLARRLVRVDLLATYLSVRPGWPGIGMFRRVLTLADPLSGSPMETRLRLIFIEGGAPMPVLQFQVYDRHGRFVARVDLAYPQWRIAIEYEGDHHRERHQFRQDIARENALHAEGWLVLRFTADDVLRHPDRLLALVLQAVNARRTAPATSIN